ncbi:competence protein ComGB [Halolactibacillus halophilus]|uniref:Competence protein ComGB n=1 Tax=Halolactibacillus halophilus TaxID=306540 RepID=A0A1I5KRD8_9BACI|nr:type II secretion system F family protein [Halolactibacillus halophilus]GEM00473.1 putative competence protein, ABC transporter subunit [Halolactibacillus halophilus]SFO87649.1 competence protein ComGB [Halolactibacillus halophilus]
MALFQPRKSTASLSIHHQLAFMKRLQTLLEAHYSMKEALTYVQFNKKFYHASNFLLQELGNGKHFDVSLAELSFHPQFVTHVHYGLLQGNLAEGIYQAVSFITQQHQLKQQFIKTIRYPLVLILGFLTILYFIQMYIYPNFLQLFQTAEQTSPMIETAIFCVSLLFYFLRISLMSLMLFGLIAVFIYKKMSPSQLMSLLLRLPIAFQFVRLHTSFFFAHHLKNLLDGHFSIKEALTLITKEQNQSILTQSLTEILSTLDQGDSLYQSLSAHSFFSDRLSYIFQTNESQALIRLSLDLYLTETFEDVTQTIEKLIKYIQPIIFSLIAMSIVLIYLSILMPMINMMNTI